MKKLFVFAFLTSLLLFTACQTDYCVNAPDCVNGKCNPQTGLCECEIGWTGIDCAIPVCNPNICKGACDFETGACICSGNFEGEFCENCADGWTGEFCNVLECVDSVCGENGYCDNNQNCFCTNGWLGEFCDCNGNNATLSYNKNGKQICNCNDGWTGLDCNTFIIPDVDFTGSWSITATCTNSSLFYTIPLNYNSTISENDKNQIIVSNFGDWNVSPTAQISGDRIRIDNYIAYYTLNNQDSLALMVSGSGKMNSAQNQIYFDHIVSSELLNVICTETWTKQQ